MHGRALDKWMLCKHRAQTTAQRAPSQAALGNRPGHTRTGDRDSSAPAPRPSPSVVQSSCLAPRSSDTLGLPLKAGSSRLRSVRKRAGASPSQDPRSGAAPPVLEEQKPLAEPSNRAALAPSPPGPKAAGTDSACAPPPAP